GQDPGSAADLLLTRHDIAIADPRCTDGQKNGVETDVDCGGVCVPCADGRDCAQDADCQSRVCKAGRCLERACDDQLLNGRESDVDCGGLCSPCDDGLRCAAGGDCASRSCSGGRCVAPTCGDQVKNGPETDVDCGGPLAECARCGDGAGCLAPGDCS